MIIYKTTNLKNGKIYIGKDSKNNAKYLGGGKLLKLAIKKYGKENFKKEILEYCETNESLNEREQYWIGKLKSQDKKIGYNILIGGEISPMFENKHTDETKKKMSLNHVDVSGKKNPMYGKTFEESWVERGLTEKEISAKKKAWLLKRSQLSSGSNNGMFGSSRKGKDNPFHGKSHSQDAKNRIAEKRKRPVLQFNLSGSLIKEWGSAKEVYTTLGIQCTNCCSGVSKTAGGFIWKYKIE